MNKTFLFSIILLLLSIFIIFFNQNHYIGIFLFSFSSNMILMPEFIKLLRKLNPNGQPIRQDGPESHILSKKLTQTGGGILLVLLSILISFFYCDFKIILPIYLTLILFTILGFYDDYKKISKKNSKGVSEKFKLLLQLIFSLLITIILYKTVPGIQNIYIPFLSNTIDIGLFFIPFGVFIIIACSNALNLTDGLDSLAITQLIIILLFFGLTILGFSHIGEFLNKIISISYMEINTEIFKFILILLGISFGFLWFNTFPAKIFMGDSGSLSLGALIGVFALIFKSSLILPIIGFIIMLESISVILQVSYFKYTKKKYSEGKRIFLMAPIHHHFEKQNIHETQIMTRMMIFSLISLAISLII